MAEGPERAAQADPAASEESAMLRRTLPAPKIHPFLAPHPLLELLSAAAYFERTLRQDSYRQLRPEHHLLQTEARRIAKAPGLQLLWHGRWMQPVPSGAAGEPLLLQTGPQGGGGVHQLEGTLQLTRGRFLLFRARLWRQAPLADEPNQRLDAGYLNLEQSRALRKGELHYLDHPGIGILVRVDPVPPSAELADALALWKSTQQAL